MSEGHRCELNENLSPPFRWRWGEHGVYLAVCSALGGFVLMLYLLPRPEKHECAAALDSVPATLHDSAPVKLAEERIASRPKVPSGRMGLYGREGYRANQDRVERAKNAGLLGILRSSEGDDHASVFGRDSAAGTDVLGNLIGNEQGGAYGLGGISMVGSGSSGGGVGYNPGRAGSSPGRLPLRALGPAAGHAVSPQTLARLANSPVASLHAPVLDPNGRFATTYRPGHGHLAWFDAELRRNRIPPQIRQLVGDLGASYAPELPAPEDRALVQQIELERTVLPPGGGPLNMRITLRSSKRRVDAARLRPPLSVHVVLDVSGSMNGEPLDRAKQAVQQLLLRLVPTDRFSLTIFDTNASVKVADGPVGPRRQRIRQRIENIHTGGSTNMAEGLELGYREATRQRLDPEWVSLVMLLSDGYPNAGDSQPESLRARAAEAFQSGVQTSAFGVSGQHDGFLMSQIAERGAGAYYYLPDVEAIPSALATELDTRLQPVAQAVEVRVRLAADVKLTNTHGSRKLDAGESARVSEQERALDAQVARRDRITQDRMREVEAGMRFFIPGFARNDDHVILLGLQVPPGIGRRTVATVELRYKDRLAHANAEDSKTIRATYGQSDTASIASLDRSVSATVQGFAAGEALVTASGWIGTIESNRADPVLAERAELMRKASVALKEPRLAADADRIDRLRQLIVGGEIRDPILLAQLLNHSGRGLLH